MRPNSRILRRSARARKLVVGAEQPVVPIHTWTIPRQPPGQDLILEARPGQIAVVVGANGSGKSALGVWLEQQSGQAVVERLNAHRRIWLEAAGPGITLDQRENLATSIKDWNRADDSRWREYNDAQRPAAALFDLLAQENYRNRQAAQLVENGIPSDQIGEQVGPSPLTRLNRILAEAGLGITIDMTARASFDAVRLDGARYPINQMSDGEKSAVILASEILTAQPGTIYLLDEPERHMHRSISASLITSATGERPDCFFVLLTHDLDLASTLPPSRTTVITVEGCRWANSTAIAWDANIIPAGALLPDGVRRAVLGGRTKILLIEGTESSLDLALFRVLYSDWTHLPAGGCEEVTRGVKGLRDTEHLHWVHACGIVDGDGRDANERAMLLADGIVVMGVHEIESIYYSQPVMAAVAAAQASQLDVSETNLLDAARAEALHALREQNVATRLAAIAAERTVQRLVRDATPNRSQIPNAGAQISVTVASPFAAEDARVQTLLAADDIETLVADYPIRDSGLRVRVAKALGFSDVDVYEAAARNAIRRTASVTAAVRTLVGELPQPAT